MKWCCFKVCGGGPSLCLWHLRSLFPTTVFEKPNAAVNFAQCQAVRRTVYLSSRRMLKAMASKVDLVLALS